MAKEQGNLTNTLDHFVNPRDGEIYQVDKRIISQYQIMDLVVTKRDKGDFPE